MFHKKMKIFLLFTCMMAGLCACNKNGNQSAKTIDGLDELGAVKIVSREEGSGTRTTFADLTGLGEMSNSTDNSDDTTKKAQVVDDAKKVIKYVSKHKNAIGYVPVGEISKNKQVKALSIDGVEATNRNISKGKYSLSRTFYLAYAGKLRGVERDFIYYIQGKGQERVSMRFVPVGKTSVFLSDKSSGTILIHGSTSMSGLVQNLAKDYMKINPNAKVKVVASDSSQGLYDAVKGTCDLGMSSRELKDYEKELLNYEIVAKDGIAVIVNKENKLEDLSMKQVKDLFRGSIKQWSDLNAKEK